MSALRGKQDENVIGESPSSRLVSIDTPHKKSPTGAGADFAICHRVITGQGLDSQAVESCHVFLNVN